MSKLVATYAEGMFAVFTEDRSGMRQRALIDIGEHTPTPKEMADLAGVLSDQWGWVDAIDKPRPVKALDKPKVKRTRDDSGPSVKERNELALAYLRDHPKSDAKQIISGVGFEPTQRELFKWWSSLSILVKANQIVCEKISFRAGPQLVRKNIYSLP